MTRLRDLYLDEIVPALIEKFQYKNVMQVPKLDKVIINIGVGEAVQNAKALEGAVSDLTGHGSDASFLRGKTFARAIDGHFHRPDRRGPVDGPYERG